MTEHAPELEESSLACFGQGTDGDLAQCVVDSTFAAGPAPELIGLLLAGTLLVSLHIAGDGTVVVPAVVTMLFGGAMVPMLPAQHVTLAYTVAIVGIAVAVFGAYSRFATQGRF